MWRTPERPTGSAAGKRCCAMNEGAAFKWASAHMNNMAKKVSAQLSLSMKIQKVQVTSRKPYFFFSLNHKALIRKFRCARRRTAPEVFRTTSSLPDVCKVKQLILYRTDYIKARNFWIQKWQMWRMPKRPTGSAAGKRCCATCGTCYKKFIANDWNRNNCRSTFNLQLLSTNFKKWFIYLTIYLKDQISAWYNKPKLKEAAAESQQSVQPEDIGNENVSTHR